MPPVYRTKPIPYQAMNMQAQAGVVRFDRHVRSAIQSFAEYEKLKMTRDSMKQTHQLNMIKLENARMAQETERMKMQMLMEDYKSGYMKAEREVRLIQAQQTLTEKKTAPIADQALIDMKNAIRAGSFDEYTALRENWDEKIAGNLFGLSDKYNRELTALEATPVSATDYSEYYTDQSMVDSDPIGAVKPVREEMTIRDARVRGMTDMNPLSELAKADYKRFITARDKGEVRTREEFDALEDLKQTDNAMAIEEIRLMQAAKKASSEAGKIIGDQIDTKVASVAQAPLYAAAATISEDPLDVLGAGDKKVTLVSNAFSGFVTELEKERDAKLNATDKARINQQIQKMKGLADAYKIYANSQVSEGQLGLATGLTLNPLTTPAGVIYAGYQGLKRISPGIKRYLMDADMKDKVAKLDTVVDNYVRSSGDNRIAWQNAFNEHMSEILVDAWGNPKAWEANAALLQHQTRRQRVQAIAPKHSVFLGEDGPEQVRR